MEINVKKQISFDKKELIVNLVTNNYFIKGEFGKVVDFSEIQKEKMLTYCILTYYTDLSMDYEVADEDIYLEKMIEDGDYEMVLSQISPNEKIILNTAINAKIEFKKKKMDEENNIAIVIKTFLDNLIAKIPDKAEMATILENFKDFDMDKFGELKDVVKLLNGNN